MHRSETGTHRSEADDVAEEDTDRVEFLTSVERGLPAAQFVSDGLGNHLVEEVVRFLDARR